MVRTKECGPQEVAWQVMAFRAALAPRVHSYEGGTLTMTELHGENPWEYSVRDCRAVGRALRRLHAAGIAHCDIHSGNMIKTSRGLRFLDFGLSCGTEDVWEPPVLPAGFSLKWPTPRGWTGRQRDLYLLEHIWGSAAVESYNT